MPPDSLACVGLPADCTLSRDPYGRLLLTRPGTAGIAVQPVRAFPISQPGRFIALVNAQGRELAWLEHLDDLPTEARRLIHEELAQREFTPEIQRIRRASGWVTPSHWDIDTDRGPTRLTLKAEEDIRRLSGTTLLISDANGVSYLIRDLTALDKASRRILDHFL